MSDLGALDRPGTPDSPGAWDERSQGWLAGETSASDTTAGETPPGTRGGDDALARTRGDTEALARTRGGDDALARTRGDTEAPARALVDAEPPAHTRAEAEATAPAHADADPPAARREPAAPRRAAADPVKALMHRHRELCERAVAPLEIAAGLEAHGVTDRTAARFRHRDVFSLAEEMYARVPRDDGAPARPAALNVPRARADWVLLTLLPGALSAATVAALHLAHGQARAIGVAVGVLAVALALRAALSRGPLGATDRRPPGSLPHAHGSRVCTYWLLAYALLGDGFLRAALAGGPDGTPTGTAGGPWPLATAPVLALMLACAPAAWSAHLFAVHARRRLTASRALEEYAASVRPLLLGTFALFLCALTALLALCGAALGEPAAYAQTVTLGALLLLARLLTTHGFTHAPALVLTATATAEVTSTATVFASRLPGCGFLATPAEILVDDWGPGSLPALVCGAAALTLLIHATRTLTRASAHAPTDQPC
ncbi:hypothetical protein [Streptomyces sp. TLI_185]|uniref:hypothetical protein n=1 Tax=Streptomyces sp. TLI_185 TaxID=2485151 RepID=UPI000FBA2D49|nr:hypothetical protein [Streptomyces sp. TLI_185]RPF36079.1 hypothetical protein EDD92_6107 [Streptomyces sp. TLI_185]